MLKDIVGDKAGTNTSKGLDGTISMQRVEYSILRMRLYFAASLAH